jgi:hypothetical protein
VILLSPNITHVLFAAAGAAAAVVLLRLVLAARLGRDVGRVPLGRNLVPLATVGNLAVVIGAIAGVASYAAIALPRSTWVGYPSSCADNAFFHVGTTDRIQVRGPRWPAVPLPRATTVATAKRELNLSTLIELDPGHPGQISYRLDATGGGMTMTARAGSYLSMAELKKKASAAFARNGLTMTSRGSSSGSGVFDTFSYGAQDRTHGFDQLLTLEECGANHPVRVTVEVELAKERVGDCAPPARTAPCMVLYKAVDTIGVDNVHEPAPARHRVTASRDGHLLLSYDTPVPLFTPGFFVADDIRRDLARDGWTVEPEKRPKDPFGFAIGPEFPADVGARLTRDGVAYRFAVRLTETNNQAYMTCRVETVRPVP